MFILHYFTLRHSRSAHNLSNSLLGTLKKRSIFGVVEGQLDLHEKVINMANWRVEKVWSNTSSGKCQIKKSLKAKEVGRGLKPICQSNWMTHHYRHKQQKALYWHHQQQAAGDDCRLVVSNGAAFGNPVGPFPLSGPRMPTTTTMTTSTLLARSAPPAQWPICLPVDRLLWTAWDGTPCNITLIIFATPSTIISAQPQHENGGPIWLGLKDCGGSLAISWCGGWLKGWLSPVGKLSGLSCCISRAGNYPIYFYLLRELSGAYQFWIKFGLEQ